MIHSSALSTTICFCMATCKRRTALALYSAMPEKLCVLICTYILNKPSLRGPLHQPDGEDVRLLPPRMYLRIKAFASHRFHSTVGHPKRTIRPRVQITLRSITAPSCSPSLRRPAKRKNHVLQDRG